MQNVALLGFGTVGASVARILDERVSDVNLTSILVRAGKEHVDPRATSDFDALLSDPALDTVVECMGGLTPAYEYIKAALTAKKNVVTSNKAVVSAHFEEFMTLAAEAGVNFKIEACVCGGIPWIAGIQKVRRIDEISAFWGIMNGTTNYIVYSMLKDGTDFAEVLSKAQELGYAERDPSSDIDGIDVRSKTMISASIAFDVICTDQIPMSGIRNLTKRDLAMFGSHDMTIKLFGRGVSDGSSYAVAVEPVAVSLSTIEANVPTNFNEIPLASSSFTVRVPVATQRQTPSCRILLTVLRLLLGVSRPSRQIFRIILSCLFLITYLGRKRMFRVARSGSQVLSWLKI